MNEEDAKMVKKEECKCDSRAIDDIEKKKIQIEIQFAYEEII
jgi:hypothetical protein